MFRTLIVIFLLQATFVLAQDAQTHYKKALQYFNKENYEMALSELKFVQVKEWKHADSWYLLGETRFILKQYKEAMMAYNKAIELDLNHFKAWKNRGRLKAALKDYRGSINDFNKAIELNP
ncbi:MAG: tetratricopeptide repeat protein, partial [Bacteroidetes bacterium]|nr:tetratricopeptide repeat protein [Bacteroidota bacterium]